CAATARGDVWCRPQADGRGPGGRARIPVCSRPGAAGGPRGRFRRLSAARDERRVRAPRARCAAARPVSAGHVGRGQAMMVRWRPRRTPAPAAARLAVFDSARAVVLDGARGLADLDPPVRRPLAAEFGARALSDRICPAEMADGTVALFALAEHVGSDQADELSRRIESAGRRMADPPRYVLSAALLLALARGGAGQPATSFPRERTP